MVCREGFRTSYCRLARVDSATSNFNISISLQQRGWSYFYNLLVLATNSSLFNKLITYDKLTTLDITEYTPDSVKSLIRYLYLGQIQFFVDCSINNFWGICYLAREYKVSWLLIEMSELLYNIIYNDVNKEPYLLYKVIYKTEEFGFDRKNFTDSDDETTKSTVRSLRHSFGRYLLSSKLKVKFLKFTLSQLLSITDDSWCQVHENIAKFCTDITLDSEDINILVLGLQKHISSSSSIQTHKVTKYLLHNVSFVTCLHYHSKLYHTFFEEFIFGDSNENGGIFTEMSVCITDAYRKSQANEKILIQMMLLR